MYIDVADINDNSPHFASDTRTIQLSELSAPGTAVLLPASHDADTAANSVTSYRLSAAVESPPDAATTDLFSLAMSTKLDGSRDVKLVLTRALDREQRDTHRLVVTAFDGGRPRRSGTLNVVVKVLDANDNRSAQLPSNDVCRAKLTPRLVTNFIRPDFARLRSLCRTASVIVLQSVVL